MIFGRKAATHPEKVGVGHGEKSFFVERAVQLEEKIGTTLGSSEGDSSVLPVPRCGKVCGQNSTSSTTTTRKNTDVSSSSGVGQRPNPDFVHCRTLNVLEKKKKTSCPEGVMENNVVFLCDEGLIFELVLSCTPSREDIF